MYAIHFRTIGDLDNIFNHNHHMAIVEWGRHDFIFLKDIIYKKVSWPLSNQSLLGYTFLNLWSLECLAYQKYLNFCFFIYRLAYVCLCTQKHIRSGHELPSLNLFCNWRKVKRWGMVGSDKTCFKCGGGGGN